MYLDSVCIYDSVVTAHRRKIKTRFAFFDEVFHQTSFAVKFDKVFWWGIHVCDDKGIHVNHLVFWLLNLAHNASFIRPWTSFVHGFTVNHSVVYLVILSPTGKCICKKRRFFTENLVSAGWHSLFRFPHTVYRDQELQNHYRREAGDGWLDNHSGTRRESAAGNRLHRYRRCV